MRPETRGQAARRRSVGLSPSGWWPVGLAVLAAVVALLASNLSAPRHVAWSRLSTEDVHSLVFGENSDHLLFGHHGGVLESQDGGRTWAELGIQQDAMTVSPASDRSIVIAGHEVFSVSFDNGVTWSSIATDLPEGDIHGFTRDPADPSRMWAALASGGLYESRSFGAEFERVSDRAALMPVAFGIPGGTRLLLLTTEGLVASDDGGRSTFEIGSPELFPVTTLAATPGGKMLLAGGPSGLARSGDGGSTWTQLPFEPGAAAIAVSSDGRTVAVVARDGSFYRSDDGGGSWPGP
jgi:photosystem II stability/assembly factor-like uncharacterized protein